MTSTGRYALPGSSVEVTAVAKAACASIAIAPPCTVRSGLVSHSDAGIVKATLPSDASRSVMPVR